MPTNPAVNQPPNVVPVSNEPDGVENPPAPDEPLPKPDEHVPPVEVPGRPDTPGHVPEKGQKKTKACKKPYLTLVKS